VNKRVPLALFLSFLVLFGWTLLNTPPERAPAEPGAEAEKGTAPPAAPPAPAAAARGEETEGEEKGAQTGEPIPEPSLAASEEHTEEMVVGDPGEPGHYRLVFSNRGGCLRELDFGDYFREVDLGPEQRADTLNWLPLVESILTADGPTGSLSLDVSPSSRPLAPGGLASALWETTPLEGERPGVEFRYGPGTGVVFTKRIRSVPGTWHLEVELEIENQTAGELGRRDFVLRPAGVVPAELGDRFYLEPRAAAVGYDAEDEEYVHDAAPAARVKEEGETLDVPVPPVFVGVHNKYFAFFLRAADAATRSSLAGARAVPVVPLEPVIADNGERHFVDVVAPLSLDLPAQGETRTWSYTVYAGPKDREVLVGDFEPHAYAISADLGFFSGISRFLLSVLGFFHRILGNWGWSIILLTICVRVVLFPVNRRSQTAMARYQKKMKRVQPKLDEIKKRHANDSQKLREAQAKLMQEERAFPPLGGCLPMFLQIPVFFGLFSALRTSFDLRQAPFMGWIHDLSRPDRLLELDMKVPLLITNFDLHYLNLLPLLMVVAWVLQQMGMPKPSDEQQAKMQKMMMFMPIMFGFFLYNYAAGLSLYMITQSSLGIVEQRVIKKVWPVDDTEAPPKKKAAGCGPFSGIMQNLAEKQKEQMQRMETMKQKQPRHRGGKQRKKRR